MVEEVSADLTSNIFMRGLVSTIIPVYNRAAMLRDAVQSVLEQTYRPIEIVIVDDGSTDDTSHVADNLAESCPSEIRVIHRKNGGPGLAREAGRLMASGEFIQYLDSDDILLPNKFKLQTEGLKAHPECGVSYGKTRFLSKGEGPVDVPWKRTGERIEMMFPSFLESRWWGTSTPLYRRSVTDAAGPWTDLKNEEDWEYDCRIASQGVILYYVPHFVSEEWDHSGERLSRRGSSDKLKLQARAVSHTLILHHAQEAGIAPDFTEMQHFARELFLLSRQCGAGGLEKESKKLFELARTASGEDRSRGYDFRLYRVVADIFGWSNIGKVTCLLDRLRPQRLF